MRETGLPRPTVVRLLQTSIALGYASRLSRQQGYRLTDRVLDLSESIRFAPLERVLVEGAEDRANGAPP